MDKVRQVGENYELNKYRTLNRTIELDARLANERLLATKFRLNDVCSVNDKLTKQLHALQAQYRGQEKKLLIAETMLRQLTANSNLSNNSIVAGGGGAQACGGGGGGLSPAAAQSGGNSKTTTSNSTSSQTMGAGSSSPTGPTNPGSRLEVSKPIQKHHHHHQHHHHQHSSNSPSNSHANNKIIKKRQPEDPRSSDVSKPPKCNYDSKRAANHVIDNDNTNSNHSKNINNNNNDGSNGSISKQKIVGSPSPSGNSLMQIIQMNLPSHRASRSNVSLPDTNQLEQAAAQLRRNNSQKLNIMKREDQVAAPSESTQPEGHSMGQLACSSSPTTRNNSPVGGGTGTGTAKVVASQATQTTASGGQSRTKLIMDDLRRRLNLVARSNKSPSK